MLYFLLSNKRKILSYVLTFLATAPIVSAQILLDNPTSYNSFSELVTGIATFIGGLAGGLATLMFTWAGILYMTARGNPEQVSRAHRALIYAAIGTGIAISGAGIAAYLSGLFGGGGDGGGGDGGPGV